MVIMYYCVAVQMNRQEVDLNSSKNARPIPTKERALVLQGGGALGAYEAGAYKALYEFLSKKDEKEGNKGKPIFDIVAGTSIGAMNAAVLTSYVVENGTYEGSAERLIGSYYHHDPNSDSFPQRNDNRGVDHSNSTSTSSHPSAPYCDFSRQYHKEIRH